MELENNKHLIEPPLSNNQRKKALVLDNYSLSKKSVNETVEIENSYPFFCCMVTFITHCSHTFISTRRVELFFGARVNYS